LRSLTQTPTIRVISSSEQAKITRANKELGQQCKKRCGLFGLGAKICLDYHFINGTSARAAGRRSETPGGNESLRKRNLDGEAAALIRPEYNQALQ
jgi:hypothetical protein